MTAFPDKPFLFFHRRLTIIMQCLQFSHKFFIGLAFLFFGCFFFP